MELIELTLGELLGRSARAYPDAPALWSVDRVWTYTQLDRESDLLSKGFLRSGLAKGDHVAVYAGNSCELVCALFALVKLGAIPVLVGGSDSPAEVSRIARRAHCRYLLFGGDLRGVDTRHIVEAASFSQLRGRFYLGSDPAVGCPDLPGLRALAALVPDGQLEQAKAAVTPRDKDMMLFTSGSTGQPKGVLLTHFARVNNALIQARALGARQTDRFCCALPLFHCFSLSAVVLPALAVGACVCFPPSHRMAAVLQTIQDCRCTAFMGVPTVFSAILARSDLDSYDLQSLRFGMIAGSGYPPSLFRETARRLDFCLFPGLGMTEATAGVSCGSPDDPPEVLSRSVGKLFPHVEGQICDTAGRPLPQGQVGEVCLRGWCVMEGYYDQPEATRAVFDAEGWFHTGDLGYFDREGNLYITGRRKELIIRGGENISPSEVENVIAADPRVSAVKVVGVPDPHYIEEACACVIAREPLSAEEVQTLVRQALARFKVPRYVLFFDAFPRTASGKWDAPRLRALAMERLGIT